MSSAPQVPHSHWPTLRLADWNDTFETLHMWTQIVGKTRLALAPMQNHWWNVALYVSPHGLATSAIPFGAGTFSAEFDFIDHCLVLQTSDGARRTLALAPRTVADFHAEYLDALQSLGIECRFARASPVEVPVSIPFAEDRQHASYDPDAAQRWWRILMRTDRVMERFRSRFVGKASPSHFFWGSFDHATTRFSGRRAPTHPGGAPNCPDYVMIEAYSRECSSCGIWPGGGSYEEPAFYAYAYPEPAGYAERTVAPAGARYDTALREFVLPYEHLRNATDPDEALLTFFQSTYEAAADLGRWDRDTLERTNGTAG
ncbi:MAG TPA: DUF5996 family protein [Zeimonas sp.]